jgi:hypothetical protein
MSDRHDDILAYFRALSKPKLLKHLEAVLELLEDSQLDDWLGDWRFQKRRADKPNVGNIEAFKDFERRSRAGEYYAPFEINSKNFRHIPPETDRWFSELDRWVDFACKSALAGKLDLAKPILDGCMHLLDDLGNDNIVFAEELGDWMLLSKYDYRAIHQQIQEG